MVKIWIETREKYRIAEYLNCSVQYVNKALRGDGESELSLRIRKEALRRGGVKAKRRVVYDSQKVSKEKT
jgi:hypothetical protein